MPDNLSSSGFSQLWKWFGAGAAPSTFPTLRGALVEGSAGFCVRTHEFGDLPLVGPSGSSVLRFADRHYPASKSDELREELGDANLLKDIAFELDSEKDCVLGGGVFLRLPLTVPPLGAVNAEDEYDMESTFFAQTNYAGANNMLGVSNDTHFITSS